MRKTAILFISLSFGFLFAGCHGLEALGRQNRELKAEIVRLKERLEFCEEISKKTKEQICGDDDEGEVEIPETE